MVGPAAQLSDSSSEEPGGPVVGHVDETRKALVRNISFDLVARVGYLVSRVCIPPFVLNRIGLTGYSLWNAVFLIVAYVGIGSIGFTSAYIKFVAEYIARGETRKANALLSSGMAICGLGYSVVFVALYYAMPLVLRWLAVPAYLRDDARYIVLLVVAMHSCEIVFSVFSAALAGCQRILEVQCVWVFHYLLEAGLIFWFVSSGYGVRGLADAFAISTGASIVLSAIVAWSMTPWLRLSPRLLSRTSSRALLGFGSVLQFSALLAHFLDAAERVVAAPLVGLDAVGLLDIGAKLPRMSALIPGAFVNAFLPASSYLEAGLAETSKGKEVLQRLYLRGSRYTMTLTGTMLGFSATAAAPILMAWLGHLYPGTVYLMTIFSIQQHFDCLTGTASSLFRGLGRPWQEFAYAVPNIVLVVIFIPLSRVFLGSWSAVGLGSAIAAAQITASIGFLIRSNRFFEVSSLRYARRVIWPSLIPYAVGALIAAPLLHVVASTNRWRGVVFIGVAGMLYTAIVTLVLDRLVLAADERTWFRQIIREQWARFGSNCRRILGSPKPSSA